MKFNFVLALALVAACAGTAFGDTIDFRGSNAALGHSQIYKPGPNSVTAYAFGGSGLLYGKNSGGSEHGVGISGTRDNEITNVTFVQLDITKISGLFSLSIGSTQNTEGFHVCFSNLLGSIGATCQDFPNPGADPFTTSNFTKSGNFVSVQADGAQANVLLDAMTYTPSSAVPEPSSLFLLGTGIAGAAGIVRRKLAV